MSMEQPEKMDEQTQQAEAVAKEEAAAKEIEMEAKRRSLDETGGGAPDNASASGA